MRTQCSSQASSNGRGRLPWRSLALGGLAVLAGAYGMGGDIQARSGQAAEAAQRLVPDHLYDVDFVDNQTGFASGYYGTLLRSRDGGSHWQRLDTGSNELLRRVEAVDAETIYSVGHLGAVLKSQDGGDSWRISHQGSNYLRDLSFADSETGWLVGHEANILATNDGGQSWQTQQLQGYQGRDLPRLNAVLALDAQRALLAGEFGVMALTEDAGTTWQLLKTPGKTTLTALAAAQDQVLAVGLDGVIWRLDLNSRDFQVLQSGTREHLFDVALDSRGRALAVGRSTLLAIDGDQVQALRAGNSVELPYRWFHGVTVLPNGERLAVGARGHIIKSASPRLPFVAMAQLGDAQRVSAASVQGAR